jgi:predicted RNase H-like HicB family nuclease
MNVPTSTTVGGKNYALSVEELGGTYVASVPNPPGAQATGSSPQAAEENLDFKLDALV